jgi:hypothetical protein
VFTTHIGRRSRIIATFPDNRLGFGGCHFRRCETPPPSGSNRQTEHRVLAGPLGRSIAQASDADAARQSSFHGSLHDVGREERERDRHTDLSRQLKTARHRGISRIWLGLCVRNLAMEARNIRKRGQGCPSPSFVIPRALKGEFWLRGQLMAALEAPADGRASVLPSPNCAISLH